MSCQRACRLAVLLPWAVVLLGGCGGGSTVRLEIEVAAAPDPAMESDDRDCIGSTGTGSAIDCYAVTVRRYEDGGVAGAVPIARPDDDHGRAQTGTLYLSSADSPSLRFDAMLVPGADHVIEVVAYSHNMPYARGVVGPFRPGDQPLRVRLERISAWSCAGQRADGSLPAARALHAAVRLPNGDVLLLGGVTGSAVPVSSTEVGAPLQRTVEVYDVTESRFYEVETIDRSAGGSPGFGAVFHRAFFLDTLPDGRYRVRVIGGFTAPGDAAAARFDATQGLTHFSSPLLPGARAEVRDSVDVLYDPVAKRAEIVSIEPGRVPRAGFDAVAPPDRDDRRFGEYTMVALGLTSGGGGGFRPTPMLNPTWYALPRENTADTMSMTLLVPRFGATASRLGDGRVLVWGGNVDERSSDPMMSVDVNARAGELIGAASGLVPGGRDGLPNSTALHTATPIDDRRVLIDDRRVLIAGGLEVAEIMGMSGGMSTRPSSQPLTVVWWGPMDRPMGIPVDPGGWQPTILHAATTTESGSVVITGGAIGPPIERSTLWATRDAIEVRRQDAAMDSYEVRRLPQMIGKRWGHAITLLPGNRVLVTGGWVRSTDGTLRAIAAAEVLSLEPPPPEISSCRGLSGPRDAGLRDGEVPPEEGGRAFDAGPGLDGGTELDGAADDDAGL